MQTDEVSTLLEQLNPEQREAVCLVDAPVLVVAGAGSGKTRVITYRIPYLLLTQKAHSGEILALTFTNKAAGEMKARAATLAGDRWRPPFITTFHSFCAFFLRKHIELLGYQRDFVIYDEDDQNRVLKECIAELKKEDRYHPRDIQYFLKIQKSKLEAPEIFDSEARDILLLYNTKLKKANALDFDDLLHLPVHILRNHPDVLSRYQDQYRFVMVDEYQDTNEIQYELLKKIAGRADTGTRGNVLVVGDEDQSIYKFRGARSENMRHFLRDFPGTRIVKLEQNYRSTKTIIKAAQEVISKNRGRIKKELWTDNSPGEPIEVYHSADEYDEADYVTLRVMGALKEIPASEIAVLYRMNAQSRVFEEAFTRAQIPHRIVGSVAFYQRKEVKDVVAYLQLLVNRQDPISFHRVINVPPRGAGKKTIERIVGESERTGLALFDAARNTGSRSITEFLQLYDSVSPDISPSAFLEDLLRKVHYEEYLAKEDPYGAQDRKQNVIEFVAFLKESESLPGFELADFLMDLPLQAYPEPEQDAVTLLTVHSAKGLEFRLLFVVGLEEGLFPHIRSMDHPDELEEERRLFYVAMTRAREKLIMTWSQKRSMFGSHSYNRPSRFLEEIPVWFKVPQASEKLRAIPSPAGNEQVHIRKNTSGHDSEGGPYRVGSLVSHDKFGRGTLLGVEGTPDDWKLTIRFASGVKTILTRYATITVIQK